MSALAGSVIYGEIATLNRELAGSGPRAVMEWAQERFSGRIAFASSLGKEDQAILHIIATEGLEIPVFTLDTGRLFPQTYDLLALNRACYGERIRTFFPDAGAVEEMVNRHGVNLFLDSVENRRECCRVRKLAPLRRALAGLDAWITGLRREQADSRTGLELIEWDEAHGIVKINPLAEWTGRELAEFIRENAVPYNPLHDQGYPSIGCACCTRAVGPDEDIRAGRWWWESGQKKECGLHRRIRPGTHDNGGGA